MHIIDLIFLALALVIAYRLYSILGQRKGNDGSGFSQGRFQEAPTQANPQPAKPAILKEKEKTAIVTPLSQIQHADPTFSQERFLHGAEKAFEMIIRGFIKGDKKALKTLTSAKLFKGFSDVIDQREKEKQTSELSFFRILKAEIKDMIIKNHKARVSVDFESEQTQLLKNSKNEIVDGDPDHIDIISETWVFERPLKNKTPNWILVETTASS